MSKTKRSGPKAPNRRTPEEIERVMNDYLNLVLKALADKARSYRNPAAPVTQKDQFLRMTEIKNAIKGIGRFDTFGIAPSSYSSCPGDCVGGVCVDQTAGINDKVLHDIAVQLQVEAADIDKIGG